MPGWSPFASFSVPSAAREPNGADGSGNPGTDRRRAGATTDRRLTILQVVPRLDLGGVERGTAEIVEAIMAAGGRAIVATEGGQLAPRIERAGGEIVEMNAATKNPLNIWQNAGVLEKLIADEGVDLVHARSRAPAWSARWASRRTGTPFVTTYHGSYSEGFPLKRLYNGVMAKGRPVIAISEHIRHLLLERHRVPHDQVVVIPRGADLDTFSEEVVSGARTARLAEAWGLLDDTRPIVMLPGRITRWKGAETLIDAAAHVMEAEGGPPDMLFLIVGDDANSGFTATLDRQIEAAGVGGHVRIVPAVADIAAAYKLASIVVSASLEPEAFGRVAVEAQAMGRPVIATDHGGARETVAHGETGWLYPPGDGRALAAAIGVALALDDSAKAHMRMSARARVSARYTVQTMQRATLAVYEQATGRQFGDV
ncbi:MAG: glycosyltransferase family 4 protein [Pseudomonadota bacterium]